MPRGGTGRAGHRNAQQAPGGICVCRMLDHAATRAAVTAERGVLAALGGGCQVPIGAHATCRTAVSPASAGVVASPDGSRDDSRRV